jgi:hypothetical protein
MDVLTIRANAKLVRSCFCHCDRSGVGRCWIAGNAGLRSSSVRRRLKFDKDFCVDITIHFFVAMSSFSISMIGADGDNTAYACSVSIHLRLNSNKVQRLEMLKKSGVTSPTVL